MIYPHITFATFLERPNRFIARVVPDGETEPVTVHVKNTGRCRELLLPGARVVLAAAVNPARKTPYDLVGVYKVSPEYPDGRLVNIDSQAPNAVVGEWLASFAGEHAFSLIKPEFRFGASRVDFYMERAREGVEAGERPGEGAEAGNAEAPQRHLLEVKGCTLEIDGVGYFPDAPTERGAKHLRELAAAVSQGYRCAVAFAIQMEGVTEVRPHVSTDPVFAEAWTAAEADGVRILSLTCAVTPDSLRITSQPCI